MPKAHEVVAAYWAAAEAWDWTRLGELDGDDRIVRITDFWPEPYEPPADRAHLAERY